VSEEVTYEKTLKPAAVETPLDLWFFRPVAYQLVRIALPTPLSANGMTVMSILTGLAGASLLRYPHQTQLVVGTLLLLLYAILDCADGQLARARGTSSRLGRILDGMSDYIVGAACGVTIAIHLQITEAFGGTLLAVLGLGSVVLQGTLFDYFKNRYLSRSNAAYREGDDLEETETEIAAGGPALEVLLYRIYALFLRVQRALGGGKPADPPSVEEAIAYGESLRPIARGWAFLGPSTHAALMTVFVILGALPAYIWVRLTLGNVVMVALYVAQRRREAALQERFHPVVQGPSPLAPAPVAAPPPEPVHTRPAEIEMPVFDDDGK
jgi:hypothetical protein